VADELDKVEQRMEAVNQRSYDDFVGEDDERFRNMMAGRPESSARAMRLRRMGQAENATLEKLHQRRNEISRRRGGVTRNRKRTMRDEKRSR